MSPPSVPLTHVYTEQVTQAWLTLQDNNNSFGSQLKALIAADSSEGTTKIKLWSAAFKDVSTLEFPPSLCHTDYVYMTLCVVQCTVYHCLSKLCINCQRLPSEMLIIETVPTPSGKVCRHHKSFLGGFFCRNVTTNFQILKKKQKQQPASRHASGSCNAASAAAAAAA